MVLSLSIRTIRRRGLGLALSRHGHPPSAPLSETHGGWDSGSQAGIAPRGPRGSRALSSPPLGIAVLAAAAAAAAAPHTDTGTGNASGSTSSAQHCPLHALPQPTSPRELGISGNQLRGAGLSGAPPEFRLVRVLPGNSAPLPARRDA